MTSKHYMEDRIAREQIIAKIGGGRPVARFTVDRGHKNGAEIHEITDTAIINIYNAKSHKLVTRLVARTRYYDDGAAPAVLIEAAREHKKAGYNRV